MYFIDVQGTLISDSDKRPIDGACEFIAHLNATKKPYVVITNNTKLASGDFLAFLRDLGIDIKDGAYLDPFCVLERIFAPAPSALFGAREFIKTMQNLGYVEDKSTPKAVLIASATHFSSGDFAKMIELINNGAKPIAMHSTSIYKKDGRLYPGVGAIAAMLEFATGVELEIIGKPSKAFYAEALKLLNAQLTNSVATFSDITIISDDARGDLLGAKELGMKTALVLSGKVSSLDKSAVPASAIDSVYSDISRVLKSIDEN